METEEELHYEEEFPSGQEAPEVQGAPAAGHDVEEEDAGVHEAQSGEAPSGGPPSLHRSSEASVENQQNHQQQLQEEEEQTQQQQSQQQQLQEEEEQNQQQQNQQQHLEEEEQQQQQSQASRSGKSDQPGPGGRRTQHRVLISNLDPSVQWQDLKDFGRKVGEVNYANVIFSGGRKYGVLEYCDSQSVVLALRELEGLRLRSLPVSLKRDRGDFDSLVASAPPRWGGPPEGGPSSAFGGGRLPPPPARGYEGEGRSRSRSWERRRYSDSKRRRASPSSSAPYMAGVAAAHPASPPDGDWRGISTRPEEALPGEGAPLPSSESRRRHRSRSPRAVRDSYGGTPAHHMQEGRYVGAQAPLGCEAVGPQGGGPPRHTRDRREGGAGGLGEAPPPHHQGGFWGGTRRDDSWPERAFPPQETAPPPQREEEVLAGDLGPPPGKRAPLLRLTEAITAPAEKGGRPLPLVAWAQDSLPTALSQRQTTLLREAPEGLQGLRDGGLTACSPKHAGAKFSLCLVAEIADRGVAAEPHWLVCSSSAFKVL
ncbi:cleavage and polyadenylation specificity factor subunit CG7185 [Cyclospora cayetanensis]|uniref:Cleavage and polyadenylation specificity factor subunit CG7185 n=1 Tax=Cyclospora cayetanensis TaxID=88456 RepID=A0A6P6RSB8_9EIME|nr:cleavage and polyadenylation specificity factor subunit CG7185 [Cyclospora cayetanensis]